MWRALVLLALIGCGGVSGSVDENGCPAAAEDWAGIATLTGGCAGAPATLDVTGGTYGSPEPGKPLIMFGGVEPDKHMCAAIVGAVVSCGNASYWLEVPQKQP